MMENEDAWKELVKTLDIHQQEFNEQLGRLKAKDLNTDPKSPLLGPIKQYSESVITIYYYYFSN
jgi:DNA-directed RNA polymerase delta subunit